MMVSHIGTKAKQAHSLEAGRHKAEELWHVTQVANLLNEEIPQIFTLCGRGPRSTLRLLRPGLAVTEMAVSPLPGNPTAVWTIKRSMLDEFDAYIIVSFTNATLVRHCLSRGQSAVTAASPERGILDISQCQRSKIQCSRMKCALNAGLCNGSLAGCNKTRWPLHLHGSLVAVCTYWLSIRDPVLPTCCSCQHTMLTAAQWSALCSTLSWHVAGVIHWRDCGGGE